MPRGVKRSRDDTLLSNLTLNDGLLYSLILRNTENGDKFYDISIEKNRVITKYGKVGSKGITVLKEFEDGDVDEMKKYIERIYHEKKRKGYEELKSKGNSSGSLGPSGSSDTSSVKKSSTSAPAPAPPPRHQHHHQPSSPSKEDSDNDSVLSGEDLKTTLFDLKKAIAQSKGFWICDTCTFQNEDDSSTTCEICHTVREIPLVAPPGQWACAHCTYLNDDSDERCLQCFVPTRKVPTAVKVEPSPAPIIKNEQPDTWNCSACTFWNELHEKRCQMCGTPNPKPSRAVVDSFGSGSDFSGDEDDEDEEDEDDEDEDDENLDDDYSDDEIRPKKKQKKQPTKPRATKAQTKPTQIHRPSVPSSHSSGSASSNSVYLEYTGGNSAKFYEIKLCQKSNGCNVSVRYGRIGSSGVEAIKHFPTHQEGMKFLTKTAESKRRKGYVDKTGSVTGFTGSSHSDDNFPSAAVTSLNVTLSNTNIMTTSITSTRPAPAPTVPSSNSSHIVPSTATATTTSSSSSSISNSNHSHNNDNALQEIYLTCKEGGSHKFYELKLFADQVKVRYGRCGTGGTVTDKNFPTSAEALKFFNKTRIEKINKGYRVSVKSADDEDPTPGGGSGSGGGSGGGGGPGDSSGDPLVDLEAGKKVYVKGSSEKPYTLKKFNGGYSCTCPGFVIQIRLKGIQSTTCKHLKEIRGENAEMLRCNITAGASSSSSSSSSSKQAKNTGINGKISLAHKWTVSKDPTGWIMSEKLDGMRAYWDGSKLWSRTGLPVYAPDWFLAGLPSNMHLDGELFLGRGLFDDCISIARRNDASDDWKKLKYIIFDAPEVNAGIMGRLEKAREVIHPSTTPYATVHSHEICQNMEHLLDKLAEIEQVGGEGLMLRHPTAPHRGGRTTDLLKVKTFQDDEAIITGYEPGKGKYQGMVGSLVCMLKNGEVFKAGSGLTDTLRSYSNIPKIGTVITFRYFELTKDGIPRFPTYMRVRPDVDPAIFPKFPLSVNAFQMP